MVFGIANDPAAVAADGRPPCRSGYREAPRKGEAGWRHRVRHDETQNPPPPPRDPTTERIDILAATIIGRVIPCAAEHLCILSRLSLRRFHLLRRPLPTPAYRSPVRSFTTTLRSISYTAREAAALCR